MNAIPRRFAGMSAAGAIVLGGIVLAPSAASADESACLPLTPVDLGVSNLQVYDADGAPLAIADDTNPRDITFDGTVDVREGSVVNVSAHFENYGTEPVAKEVVEQFAGSGFARFNFFSGGGGEVPFADVSTQLPDVLDPGGSYFVSAELETGSSTGMYAVEAEFDPGHDLWASDPDPVGPDPFCATPDPDRGHYETDWSSNFQIGHFHVGEGSPETEDLTPEQEETPDVPGEEPEQPDDTPGDEAPELEGAPEEEAPETEQAPEEEAPETEQAPEEEAPETEQAPEDEQPEPEETDAVRSLAITDLTVTVPVVGAEHGIDRGDGEPYAGPGSWRVIEGVVENRGEAIESDLELGLRYGATYADAEVETITAAEIAPGGSFEVRYAFRIDPSTDASSSGVVYLETPSTGPESPGGEESASYDVAQPETDLVVTGSVAGEASTAGSEDPVEVTVDGGDSVDWVFAARNDGSHRTPVELVVVGGPGTEGTEWTANVPVRIEKSADHAQSDHTRWTVRTVGELAVGEALVVTAETVAELQELEEFDAASCDASFQASARTYGGFAADTLGEEVRVVDIDATNGSASLSASAFIEYEDDKPEDDKPEAPEQPEGPEIRIDAGGAVPTEQLASTETTVPTPLIAGGAGLLLLAAGFAGAAVRLRKGQSA